MNRFYKTTIPALTLAATIVVPVQARPVDTANVVQGTSPATVEQKAAAGSWVDATGHHDVTAPRSGATGESLSGGNVAGRPDGIRLTDVIISSAIGEGASDVNARTAASGKEQGQFAGGSDDGQSIRRKQPRKSRQHAGRRGR